MMIKIIMIHSQYKIYLVVMAFLLCHNIRAQETKLTKSISKSFETSDRLNLEITNKYGNVIIETWSKNEVSIKIEILSFGKDENSAKKLMDRVEFDFKQSSDYLEIESVFDRKKSFFKDMMNAIGDYSASILSKHKLQVNYELNVPESIASLTIDNRFGDVHIGEIDGRFNITIAHGDLRINNIADHSRLTVNYGKVRIKEANELNLSMKGSELELETARKLKLRSSSSTIFIGEVSILDIESTNDNLEINEVKDISGTANFSEVSISNLKESCRIDQSYGALTIKNVTEDFASIRLKGKSTDYSLRFPKTSNFNARIYARDDKLNIIDFPGDREKRYLDDKSKFVRVTGSFGAGNEERKLNIDAQNGEVKIDFVDVLPETYNK